MNIIKISKALDFLSLLGIVAVIGYYIFAKPSLEITLTLLLMLCILRMIGSNMKSNFYEKEYKKLKDDNEFMMRHIDEIKGKENK